MDEDYTYVLMEWMVYEFNNILMISDIYEDCESYLIHQIIPELNSKVKRINKTDWEITKTWGYTIKRYPKGKPIRE